MRPSTVFAMDVNAKPPYAQNWNVSVQRSLFDHYLVEVRYVGAAGSRLPRNVEANPAVYGPGATAQNADRRRIYANCPADGGTCDFSTIAMLSNITSSNFHSGQVALSRRYCGRRRVQRLVLVLEISGLSLGDESVGRGGEAAGGRERPRAESLRSRCRVRPVALRRAPPLRRQRELGAASCRCRRTGRCVRVLDGWQINVIATHNSGTPFTVSDSTNVALQANSPPISGFAASRPNVVGDPNAGPRTVDAWISRSAFQRLEPATQAGQFGNAGRNIARGPAYTNVDVVARADVPARR